MDRPRASHREERFRKSRLEECMQMPEEPELPDVPDDDKPIIRNIIYTAWAMQEVTASTRLFSTAVFQSCELH